MPGILPMKVIRVGNSSQSRIAQACDRCRSKKIRCDGNRPCCTQCANVGFECKTSDKLSRRAFPRGYTESLEDRVRSLETEVRELKLLLDEKDEKIDVLSRIRSFPSPVSKNRSLSSKSPAAKSSSPSTPVTSEESKSNLCAAEPLIRVQPLSSPSKSIRPETAFSNGSSTRAFTSIVAASMQQLGKTIPSIHSLTSLPVMIKHPHERSLTKPSRLVSDQLINIFFQEWAPLYPVVHRPTILQAYDHYISDSPTIRDNKYAIAQLNLIFSIAAGSSKSRTNQDPVLFERNWYPILESLTGEPSITAVQCYLLAQIYCMARGDYRSLLRYRGLSISLCQMLGLHDGQVRFTSNPLKDETRKRAFWCQYVLDRFTSALTSLPSILREQDISIEFPEDVDDENVTETTLLPNLPGESTRLSSALALFSAARILHKVVDQLYASTATEIPLSRIRDLADELDAWQNNLPTHLRLEYANDRPSTNMTSSRSPVLSLVFHYIRTLIHRPAASYAPSDIALPSVLTIANSCKHIIQILQLLDERRMSLSVSINRVEVVFVAGLGLLWPYTSLKRNGKLVKEGQQLLTTVIEQLESESPASAAEFSILVNLLTSVESHKQEILPHNATTISSPTENGLQSNSAPKQLVSRNSHQVTGNTLSSVAVTPEPTLRRVTVCANQQPPVLNKLLYPIAPSKSSRIAASGGEKNRSFDPAMDYNLDYYTLGSDLRTMSRSDLPRAAISDANWELILRDLDWGPANIHNSIYGGKEPEDKGPFAVCSENVMQQYHPIASAFAIPLQTKDNPQLSPRTQSSSSREVSTEHSQPPQSILGTEDGLGSAEGLPLSKDFGIGIADSHNGIAIPHAAEDFYDLELLQFWDQHLPVSELPL